MSKKLPTKDEKVVRSFGMPDIRAVDDAQGIIEGHAAVFDQKANVENFFYEIIERGAFEECDFRDVLFTANHNILDIPLARSRRNNNNSTLQLSVDSKGLFIRGSLDIENNTEAKNLYSAVKRGDIDGMSFIFYVKEHRWENLDNDMPTRYVEKIATVREVSAVNYPIYSGADINARGLTLENARMALENARATLENEKKEQLELLKLRTQILLKG